METPRVWARHDPIGKMCWRLLDREEAVLAALEGKVRTANNCLCADQESHYDGIPQEEPCLCGGRADKHYAFVPWGSEKYSMPMTGTPRRG